MGWTFVGVTLLGSTGAPAWQWVLLAALVVAALAAMALARGRPPTVDHAESAPALLAQLQQIATRSGSTVPTREEVSYQLAALDSLASVLGDVIDATTDTDRRMALVDLDDAVGRLRGALEAVAAYPDAKQGRVDVHTAANVLSDRVSAIRDRDAPED